MTYFFIFVIVWALLVLFSNVIIRWPREAKEIGEKYPKRLLLVAFLSPRVIQGTLSEEHFRVFLEFRKRYLLFWIIIAIISVTLLFLSYSQFKSESASFSENICPCTVLVLAPNPCKKGRGASIYVRLCWVEWRGTYVRRGPPALWRYPPGLDRRSRAGKDWKSREKRAAKSPRQQPSRRLTAFLRIAVMRWLTAIRRFIESWETVPSDRANLRLT